MESIAAISPVASVDATDAVGKSVKVPYGASLSSDITDFAASMNAARERQVGQGGEVSDLAKAAFKPLDHINKEAESLGNYAQAAMESDNSLTPGEIVNLTVQSQKFMFHSQLVANIANRSADGIQQLFRQQG